MQACFTLFSAQHFCLRENALNRSYMQLIDPLLTYSTFTFKKQTLCLHVRQPDMVGEMVQNSQSLYSFAFNAIIIVHEYIYSHSTTKFLFKKYIHSHLTTYFLFTNIFTHIYKLYIHSHSTVYIRSHSRSKYWFNTVQYSFNIFCAPSLRIISSQLPASPPIFLRSADDK